MKVSKKGTITGDRIAKEQGVMSRGWDKNVIEVGGRGPKEGGTGGGHKEF